MLKANLLLLIVMKRMIGSIMRRRQFWKAFPFCTRSDLILSCDAEPVAAAIAYGLGRPQDDAETILVVDVGGGTTDISVLESFEGIIEVCFLHPLNPGRDWILSRLRSLL